MSDEEHYEFTAEELLETVLNLAASTVEAQYDDTTRETLWVILDACAQVYGIEVVKDAPPKHYPFRITDATPRKPNNGKTK
jgi:hypothetical protein